MYHPSLVVQIVKVVGGLVLLVGFFQPRYRREAPRWVRCTGFLSAVLLEVQVAYSYLLAWRRVPSDSPLHFIRSAFIWLLIFLLVAWLIGWFSRPSRSKPAA